MDVLAGSTDVTTYFSLRLSATGLEATGLTITDIDLQYTRSGSTPAAKADATALAATNTAHTDNYAIEVDATDQPGLYRIDWPDAAFASGAREVLLSVKCASVITEHLRVNLTPVAANVTQNAGVGITSSGGRQEVKLADVSHGGSSAVFTFDRIRGNSTSGACAIFTGESSGAGIESYGGGGTAGGGPGVSFIGGAGTGGGAGVDGAGMLLARGGSGGDDLKLTNSDMPTFVEAFFTNNPATDYAGAAAGSLVKEIADNAGGSSLSETGIAETVCEYMFTHNTGETYGSSVAGSVVQEIADNAGGGGGLDAAGVRAAVGLASANLDTQLGAIDDFLDTEVAAIKTKTDFLPSATAGAAGGLFIAGTNAATTVTTSFTTTFTGNLTGSVGSVTGAVGSVTGAVGSVTGAVGSIASGGITSSSFGAGAIDAAAIAADAIGSSELAATAASEIATAVRTELATELARVDAAITSRMASYTQPTGFLAATFPTTVASTTNITAGTITTATNVTTVNGLAAGVITAASIASDAITDAKVASDVTIASVTGSVGSVTGNVGGNVTGSVGSVLGGINTTGGTITTLDALDTAQDTQHGTTQTAIGVVDAVVDGIAAVLAGITSLASWLGALAGKTADNATQTEIRATTAGAGYTITTDSQEAIRDQGDAAWLTATGFSTHTAADVWAVATRVLTAGTNIVLAKGTGVTGFNDLSAAQVNAEVDMAIADVGLTSTITGRIDVATSTRLASGSYTAPDNASIAAILIDTNELQTDWVNGGRLDLILDGTATPAQVATALNTYDAPTHTELTNELAALQTHGDSTWATATGFSTLTTADIPTTAQIADKVLGRNLAGGSDGGRTVTDALRVLRNRAARAANTLTVYAEDDLTTAWTASITTDDVDPITEVDPA